MSSSNVPSKAQLLKTLRKLEKNPKDSAAILGEIGITVFGASAVGFAVSAMGVTTAIPVITAVTGIVLVEATPIGWVATAAVAGGVAAYGLAQVLKHGSKAEATKAKLKEDIKKSLKDVEAKERASNLKPKDLSHFSGLSRQALESNLISRNDAFELLNAISNGSIPLTEAYKMLNNILVQG